MDLTSKLIAGTSNGHFSFESFEKGLNSINSILGYMQDRGLSMESDTLGLRGFVQLNREGLPDWVVDMSGESFESQSSTKKNFLVRAYEWIVGKLKQFWNWLTGNKTTYDQVTAKADAEFERSKTMAANASQGGVDQDALNALVKKQQAKVDELTARVNTLQAQDTPESKAKLKETKEKVSTLEDKIKKVKSGETDPVPSIKWFRGEPATLSSFKTVLNEFEQKILSTIDNWNEAISKFSNARSVDEAEAVSWTPYLHPQGIASNKWTVELSGESDLTGVYKAITDVQVRLRPKIVKFRKDLYVAIVALYRRMDADAAKLKANLTVDDTEAINAINKQIATMRSLISLRLNVNMIRQADDMIMKCATLPQYFNPLYRPKTMLDH